MFFDRVSVCFSVFVLFCCLNIGSCLDCYHCNATLSSTTSEDPCKGKATLQRCQDPAVCLSASYSYKDPSAPVTITTMKTCYLNMGGSECPTFLQNIRNIHPSTAQIEFTESCATCTENGCNHNPTEIMFSSASSTVSAVLLVLFSVTSIKLL